MKTGRKSLLVRLLCGISVAALALAFSCGSSRLALANEEGVLVPELQLMMSAPQYLIADTSQSWSECDPFAMGPAGFQEITTASDDNKAASSLLIAADDIAEGDLKASEPVIVLAADPAEGNISQQQSPGETSPIAMPSDNIESVIAGTMEPKPDEPSQLADEPIKTVPTTDEAQLALVTGPGDAARDSEPETTGSISAPAPTPETAVPETEFSGSDFDEICN